MNEQNVCYTFEAAMALAIKMEDEAFQNYLAAIRKLENKGAREILKEAAFDELEHKHQLEKALLEGSMESPEEMNRPVPTMRLDYILTKKELSSGSIPVKSWPMPFTWKRSPLISTSGCWKVAAVRPMTALFQRLGADESRHLQTLEDMYEQHFLPEG